MKLKTENCENQENQRYFFEKINKINETLGNLIKKKRERKEFTNVRNKSNN